MKDQPSPVPRVGLEIALSVSYKILATKHKIPAKKRLYYRIIMQQHS